MANFQEIINSNSPVLIDLFAEWCGPCKMMPPILKEVKQKLGEEIRILKIDVDKNQALATQLGVRGVPTLILFQNGQQLWRQSGVLQSSQIVDAIKQHAS